MSIVTYQIDSAHSSAQFSVRHMMIANVKGEFTGISGTVAFDADKPAASTIDVVIDASSIATREPQRDAHLKSPDFLDTAKYPSITFKSTRVEASAPGYAQVTGDLTIHGVTKPVVLEVDGPTPEIRDPWGMLRRGATATAKVNRKDFGLTWNTVLETGGVLVGDDIKITLDVEFVRQPEGRR
ncbi:MAG TPA: YceI family protein [Bryobacteraceae bacterium]|nr:YceI family protein [Bryobacteraceae bacterium]